MIHRIMAISYSTRKAHAVILLIACRLCSSTQQCNSSPPSNLTVPAIVTSPAWILETSKCSLMYIATICQVLHGYYIGLRPKIGGNSTDWWTVFSETQVREHGLWCQVLPEDNMGMGDNIGDWYYPPGDTPDGSTLVPTNDPSNTVPYQSLKCTNQIGLMVHGDVMNNQGIVRCTTTITGLKRQSNHMVVYSDSVFNNYSESYP